ncbi:MAG: hypothetical protein ACRCUM_03500 [Mycoplasmoidaceae bacterium]
MSDQKSKTRKFLFLRENSNYNEPLLKKFFKIFFVYFSYMLTIVFHNLIPLSINSFNAINNVSGGIVSQSIGYTQPISFFSVTIIVMISVQILTITKNNFKSNNKRDYFKEIINTGSATLLMVGIGIAIIFGSTMLLYSEYAIAASSHTHNDKISKFINEYSSMMILNLLLIAACIYYTFILLEYKIHFRIIILIQIIHSLISIGLSVLFIFYTDLSPAISLPLSSIIVNIIYVAIILFIFYYYVANWKIYDFNFDKPIFKMIVNGIYNLSIYMLVYSLTMITQMILITFINVNNPNLVYLYTTDGEYLIIMSRIVIYSIINLLITIPRSMGRAINLYYDQPKLNLKKSEKQFKESIILSIKVTIIFLLVGLIISTFIIYLVDFIFNNQGWSQQIIPSYIANTIPFPHGENIKYIDIIKKFIYEGFLLSLTAQTIQSMAINTRNAVFYNFKRKLRLFWIILLNFFIIEGILSYFLGVVMQKELPGMIGFSIAQIINASAALITILIGVCYCKNKLMNDILKSNNKDTLSPIYKSKSIKEYILERKKKRLICLDCN